jgi:predicted metal-dependent hydrolase
MKQRKFLTGLSGDIEINIERKNVKSIRLKVFPTGCIMLSAPVGVSDEWINDYLDSKTGWIEKSLHYFKDTGVNGFETIIRSGISTRILGRQKRIIINEGRSCKIEQKEDIILIHSPNLENKQALQKQFERWWHKQSKLYFLLTIDRLYPVIAKHGINKPDLQVRKMKTLWGSCSRTRGRINLNYYLYKASPPCIDYVVLHELIHFLYPNHNKDFYEFLTVHMPDWRERKRILDHEIVKELGYSGS